MTAGGDPARNARAPDTEGDAPTDDRELVGQRWRLSWPWSVDWTLTVLGTLLVVAGLLSTAAFLLIWTDRTVDVFDASVAAEVLGGLVLVVGAIVSGIGKTLADPPIAAEDRDRFERKAYAIFHLGWGWNLARFVGLGFLLAGGYLWYHLGYVAPGPAVDVMLGGVAVATRILSGAAAVLGAGLIVAAQIAKAIRERMRDRVLLAYHEQQLEWIEAAREGVDE